MELFERNNTSNNIKEDEFNEYHTFPFPLHTKETILAEQPSKVEKAIEKASGSLSKTIKLLFFLAGLLTFIALFRPYLRFLFELSDWAYKKIGWIFY